MWRNFDNHDRYYDRDGNPLHGCVQFNVKDGTTPLEIYDGDNTPISNPQLTDALGRTAIQVFVNADTVAYFYKYIGQGSLADEYAHGIDTSDESKWALQYTNENSMVDTRAVSGISAMGVNSIDELRSIDPTEVPEVGGKKVVTLYGYYTCGDKEPINYVWDELSEELDDNGSVIKNGEIRTGRWKMVTPTEHCDSRHFGVFPQDSYNTDRDHTTGITQLVNYCNSKSISPFFNGSASHPYFKYSALAVESVNPIDVSEGTVFVDSNNSLFYGEWNGNPYFRNAATTVKAVTVRHSWHFRSHVGTVDYIVDTDAWPVNVSNVNAILEVSPAASSQFTDCEMVSNEKITRNIVLENMTVHTDWFADNYDWGNLQIFGCKIVLQNCSDANKYVMLKNKQHEPDYGDLGEQTLTGATLLANCIAENASFSNVTLTGSAELHNVSGSVQLNGAAYNLNFIDCWISFTNTTTIVMENIAWRRGSVTASVNIQPLVSLMLDNVDVNAPFYSIGVEAKFYGCSINVAQHLFRDVQVIDCRVFANIFQYPQYKMPSHGYDGYYWCGMYSGNTFIGYDGRIMLSPISGVDYSSLHLGLETKICNNVSDHNFVDDTRWQGVTKGGWASTQDFRYEGNKGGCPVFEDELTYSIPYTYTGWVDDDSSFCSNVPGTTDSTGCWIVRDGRSTPDRDVSYDIYWIVNFKNVPVPVGNLFRLPNLRGTRGLLVDASVQVFLRPDDNSSWPFYLNTFEIKNPMTACSVGGNDTTAYMSSIRPMKFHHAGIRYCDNDDIDDWRSSLTYALYTYRNKANCFVGSMRLRFKFDDFGKTTPTGI